MRKVVVVKMIATFHRSNAERNDDMKRHINIAYIPACT